MLFICGGLWNALRGYQPLMKSLTPIVLISIACAAFLLSYRLTMRNVGAALAVLIMTFICAVSGGNFGFPFGDYAYTNALGPKLLDVPLVIPFLWLQYSSRAGAPQIGCFGTSTWLRPPSSPRHLMLFLSLPQTRSICGIGKGECRRN